MKSLKPTVPFLSELYANYLNGGESGWFAFVQTEQKFYEWKNDQWSAVIFNDTLIIDTWLRIWDNGIFNIVDNSTDTPIELVGAIKLIVFTDYVGKQVKIAQCGSNVYYIINGKAFPLWIKEECDEQDLPIPEITSSIERIPVLRYQKDPVDLIEELYLKFPNGGELGWFSFVRVSKTFAYWDVDLKKWELLQGSKFEESDPIFTKWLKDGGDKITSITNTGISVGGIPANTDLRGKSLTQFADMLLNPELWPTLTNPWIEFTLYPSSQFEEIGKVITVSINRSFNRGSIFPKYGTSGNRSGALMGWVCDGKLGEHTVVAGIQNWTCRADYEAGEQPLGSKGGVYQSALPAGSTSQSTRSIVGVFPFFATSTNGDTLTKQGLVPMSNPYFGVTLIAESAIAKQRVEFPTAFNTITGIQFFNTINNTWEWIGGSKANSLLTFSVSTHDDFEYSTGLSTDYIAYTHNGATIGSRQLRFYTT